MRQARRSFRAWIVVGLVAAGAMTWLLATTFAGSAGAQAGTITTWVTVSGAAFTPERDSCFDYTHNGYSGAIEDDDECEYVADVALPHGSTVTGVWAYFDADGEEAELHLEENDDEQEDTPGHVDMAEVFMDDCEAEDEPSERCVVEDLHIVSPGVDNAHRSYGIWLDVQDCCGFDLHRVAIRLSVPINGAAAVSPASPGITAPSKHGHGDSDPDG